MRTRRDGRIFVSTYVDGIWEIDPRSGEILRKYRDAEQAARLRFQPVIQDGRIFVPTEDDALLSFDTGRPELTGWKMWGGNAGRTGQPARW